SLSPNLSQTCFVSPEGVFVALTDEIQSVSVIEGNSVLLLMDVTEIQDDDNILWKFGADHILIAKINRDKQIFSTFDVPDGRFRDRLKLDKQTGSLTITDITTQHAGHYQLQITGAKWSSKTFSVSVYDHLFKCLHILWVIRGMFWVQHKLSSASTYSICSILLRNKKIIQTR
uniref:Immunoglobulin domain-containing protein n=1 Tax=Cyprinus carpio carpio TaxID=630221 RepID=A0A8C1HR64_CYPCA